MTNRAKDLTIVDTLALHLTAISASLEITVRIFTKANGPHDTIAVLASKAIPPINDLLRHLRLTSLNPSLRYEPPKGQPKT